jgi:hypothetical protein
MNKQELAARRAALQERIRYREAERQALASIGHEVAALTERGTPFATSTSVLTTWHWIETHFPLRTPSLHDRFIDWTRVTDCVVSAGPDEPMVQAWLRAVIDAQALGDPSVRLFWGLEAAVELRLLDALANADLVTERIACWIACPTDGWVFQFLEHRWGGWGWGRVEKG